MRILIMAAALAIPATEPSTLVADSQLRAPGRDCPKAQLHYADRSRGAVARRLDQLPAARLEFTVLREIDRCPIPAVLREGIGAVSPIRR